MYLLAVFVVVLFIVDVKRILIFEAEVEKLMKERRIAQDELLYFFSPAMPTSFSDGHSNASRQMKDLYHKGPKLICVCLLKA